MKKREPALGDNIDVSRWSHSLERELATDVIVLEGNCEQKRRRNRSRYSPHRHVDYEHVIKVMTPAQGAGHLEAWLRDGTGR